MTILLLAFVALLGVIGFVHVLTHHEFRDFRDAVMAYITADSAVRKARKHRKQLLAKYAAEAILAGACDADAFFEAEARLRQESVASARKRREAREA